jgi:CheY-specific phosphatase CheX
MKSLFPQVFNEVLVRSAEPLFTEHGLPKTDQKPIGRRPPVGEREVAGLVAFQGERLRGSLVLLGTFEVVAKTRAGLASNSVVSRSVARDWILMRDWVGELANQLVGRVKNRLLAFGLDMVVAPPVPLSGRALALALQQRREPREFAFGRGEDVLWVVVDFQEEPPLSSTTPVAAEAPAKEGDVIEF